MNTMDTIKQQAERKALDFAHAIIFGRFTVTGHSVDMLEHFIAMECETCTMLVKVDYLTDFIHIIRIVEKGDA